jgi:hypothetical protein
MLDDLRLSAADALHVRAVHQAIPRPWWSILDAQVGVLARPLHYRLSAPGVTVTPGVFW